MASSPRPFVGAVVRKSAWPERMVELAEALALVALAHTLSAAESERERAALKSSSGNGSSLLRKGSQFVALALLSVC